MLLLHDAHYQVSAGRRNGGVNQIIRIWELPKACIIQTMGCYSGCMTVGVGLRRRS